MLGPTRDHRRDAAVGKLPREILTGLLDVVLAFVPLLRNESFDLGVLAWVQRRECKILQFPLDRVDTQTVSERSEDVQCLA